jgi:hypothetical protein
MTVPPSAVASPGSPPAPGSALPVREAAAPSAPEGPWAPAASASAVPSAADRAVAR